MFKRLHPRLLFPLPLSPRFLFIAQLTHQAAPNHCPPEFLAYHSFHPPWILLCLSTPIKAVGRVISAQLSTPSRSVPALTAPPLSSSLAPSLRHLLRGTLHRAAAAFGKGALPALCSPHLRLLPKAPRGWAAVPLTAGSASASGPRRQCRPSPGGERGHPPSPGRASPAPHLPRSPRRSPRSR